jgi:hypothetical protein
MSKSPKRIDSLTKMCALNFLAHEQASPIALPKKRTTFAVIDQYAVSGPSSAGRMIRRDEHLPSDNGYIHWSQSASRRQRNNATDGQIDLPRAEARAIRAK